MLGLIATPVTIVASDKDLICEEQASMYSRQGGPLKMVSLGIGKGAEMGGVDSHGVGRVKFP